MGLVASDQKGIPRLSFFLGFWVAIVVATVVPTWYLRGMPSLPPCRWCLSGVPWNSCLCEAARYAQRWGFSEALKRYPLGSGDGGLEKAVERREDPSVEAREYRGAEAASERGGSLPRDKRGRGRSADPRVAGEGDTDRQLLADESSDGVGVGDNVGGSSDIGRDRGGMLAPAGVCAYCDRRRVAKAAAMRTFRANQKKGKSDG